MKLGEFKPQALSNTVYALAQLGIIPPPDWRARFWGASTRRLGEFTPQELSNTLYACGKLGITPPDDWLAHFWDVSKLKLGKFNSQDHANTLYACGQLGIALPPDWLQPFMRACERALPDMTEQGVANTALALATLAAWELPLWRGLWERLCMSVLRDIQAWNSDDCLHAMQLYQVYQAAAVERPGLLAPPSPELLAAARKYWVDARAMDSDTISQLHDAVSACLTRMDVVHANEHWCKRAERSIDIVVAGAAPIALEVDGPRHFLQDGRPNGSTSLRNRMLAAHGWRVVVVDYSAWDKLTTPPQQEEYLRRMLA